MSVVQRKPTGDWRFATLFLILPVIYCIDLGMMGKQVRETIMADEFRDAAQRPRHMRYGIKSSKDRVGTKFDDWICAVIVHIKRMVYAMRLTLTRQMRHLGIRLVKSRRANPAS